MDKEKDEPLRLTLIIEYDRKTGTINSAPKIDSLGNNESGFVLLDILALAGHTIDQIRNRLLKQVNAEVRKKLIDYIPVAEKNTAKAAWMNTGREN